MKPSSTHSLFALAIAALLAVAGASSCVAPQGDSPRLGSESHFLMSCFSESECPTGLGCLCGVCTVSCDTETQCSAARLRGAAEGFSTACSAEVGLGTAALCGPFSQPPGLCVAECSVDAECGAVAGRFVCDLGRCRDLDLPSNGLDASVGDARDAGVEDAVDTSSDAVTGADVVDVDELELDECPGDLVSTLEQLEMLAGCQRILSDLTIRDIALTSESVGALVDVQGSFRVLNVSVNEAELRFDGLRRVTGDFAVQAVTGATTAISAGALESAANVDVANLQTGALVLSSLEEVAGSCVFADAAMSSVDLQSLRVVGDTLSMRSISTLRALPLDSLMSVGSLELEGLAAVEDVNAPQLSGGLATLSLSGMSSLVSLGIGTPVVIESLRIQRMNTWTDLAALSGVTSGPNLESVVLAENALLRTSEGLSMTNSLAAGALLNVERNPRLAELGTLTNITTIGAGARVSVSANVRLPQCAVSAWLQSTSIEITDDTIGNVASGNDEDAVCE